ncbi:uncharacterized [Tachysurus ichikawai]
MWVEHDEVVSDVGGARRSGRVMWVEHDEVVSDVESDVGGAQGYGELYGWSMRMWRVMWVENEKLEIDVGGA